MEIEFIFDSEYFSTNGECNQISVTCYPDGDQVEGYAPTTYTIFDMTANTERELKDFPKDEQTLIECLAQELVNEIEYEDYDDV